MDLIKTLYQIPIAEEILQTPISKIANMEDKLIWKFLNSSDYKVNKAYCLLQQANSPFFQGQGPNGIHCSIWKMLWKLKLPLKVLNFIWKLLHDSIPVFEKLRSRGISVSNVCLICNEEGESVNHLFLQCPFTRAIWHGSILGIRTSFLESNSVVLVSAMTDRVASTSTGHGVFDDNRMFYLQSMFTILWSIWNHRNQVLHKGKIPNPKEVILIAQSFICKYQEEFSKERTPSICSRYQEKDFTNHNW